MKEWPQTTFLIAAYNEEAYIRDKIINTLNLEYPKDKMDIWVVTDGSSDNTAAIVREFPAVKLFHKNERRGKIHAVNRVMRFVKSPIVVFSDANTMLNVQALQNMVRHYSDPKVGGVSGEKRIVDLEEDNASGSGEGLYWKYESFLKKMDSDLNSIVGSAGELFSVRTSLYEYPPSDMVIEDFFISMKIAAKGYRFVYEPAAMATETASATVEDEWKRKVRISAGGLQAIARLKDLLNPWKYGVLTFQYVSHRVLRWTLAPLALLVVFITNIWLAVEAPFVLYDWLLIGQLLFYSLAFVGFLLRNEKVGIKGFFVPFYFSMMNFSVYAGFIRYVRKEQAVTWEKTRRAAA